MAKYDLYNLSDDVLFLSKEGFYEFVAQVCGQPEANLLQIQGIQNAHSLIRCTNFFSILSIDGEEIEKLKPIICFLARNGEYFIKQGVQLNLDNLSDSLKEKQIKYKKSAKRRAGLTSSYPTFPTASPSDTLPGQNSSGTTDAGALLDASSSKTNPNELSLNCMSAYDHAQFIQDLIEKFSRKILPSTVLKSNEHYTLTITQEKDTFKAFVKCQCGAKLILPSRSKTNTFVLSNYYTHLTTTNCSMVNRVIKQEKELKNKDLQQPSSNSNSPKRTNVHIDSSEPNTNKKQKISE